MYIYIYIYVYIYIEIRLKMGDIPNGYSFHAGEIWENTTMNKRGWNGVHSLFSDKYPSACGDA